MNRILLVAVLLFTSVVSVADGNSSRLADSFDKVVCADVDVAHFDTLLDETDQSANGYSSSSNFVVSSTGNPALLAPTFYSRSLKSNAIRAPPLA